MTYKLWTIFLIFITNRTVANFPTDSITSQKIFLTRVFKSLVENDKHTYIKCLFSTKVLKHQITEAKDLTNISGRQEQFIDSVITTLHHDYLVTESQNFSKIQSKLNGLKISAENVLLDSITFSSKLTAKLSAGTIYFKKSNNSEFYKINFRGVYAFNGSYYLETVFVPYIYIGPKNRQLTAGFKRAYIDTCLKLAQEFIDSHPNKQLSEAIFGKCPPCYCEKKYVNDTEETDAINRIKNPSFDFKLPDKYKKKTTPANR